MKIKSIFIYLLVFVLLISTGCSNKAKNNAPNSPEIKPATQSDIESSDQNYEEEIGEFLNLYYGFIDNEMFPIAYNYLSPKSQEIYSVDKYTEYKEYQNLYYKLTDFEISKINYFSDDNILVELSTSRFNSHNSSEESINEVANLERIDDEYKIILNDIFRLNTATASSYIAFQNNRDGNFELAIYDSKVSIEIYPLSHIPYHELAIAYSFSGNMDSALEIIDEYITLYSKIGENTHYLSSMYELKGMNLLGLNRRTEAIASYERAYQVNPNDELSEFIESLKNQ